jgi:hypothetical protein
LAALQKAGAYPRQTKEVRVTMRAAFRAIDLIQVLKREFQLGCKSFYSIPKITSGQWRELVEHGLDDSWVDDNHDKLERNPTTMCN